MCIESAELRAGDDGVRLVEDKRCRFQLAEESLGGGVHRVLVEDIAAIGATPSAVLHVGRGEEIVAVRVSDGRSFRPPIHVAIGLDVVAIDVAVLSEVHLREQAERGLKVLVLEAEEVAAQLRRKRVPAGGCQSGVGLGVARGGRNAEQVVACRVSKVGHRRLGSTQDERERRLDGDAGQRRGVGQAGLDDGAVEDAVVDEVIVRVAVLPIPLRIEVGARLPRVGDAMHEREVAGVVNGGEEFQRGMQRAEAVAERNRAGVAVGVVVRSARGAAEVGVLSGVKASTDAAVVRIGPVLGNPDRRPAGRVLGIENRDDGVQGIVGAAQPDEEDFLAVGSDAAGSERALHDERNV